MKKQVGIYIRNETVRDAHHPQQGNPDLFIASIAALIDAGNSVAVGENSIERVFDTSEEFSAWFAGMAAVGEGTSAGERPTPETNG